MVSGVCLAVAATLAGCGSAAKPTAEHSSTPESRAASTPAASTIPDLGELAMDKPGKLKRPIFTSDVLVFSRKTLPDSVVAAIRHLKGVAAIDQMSMAQFFVEEQPVTLVAVRPDTFRRFTVAGTAQTQAVWDRVAAGEMAINPALGKTLQNQAGYVSMGNSKDAPSAHIGAYAELAPRIDAAVNERWAKKLGMPKGNAILLTTGFTSPQKIQKQLIKIAGKNASVQILGPNLDTSVSQTIVLTGTSVASAVGTFNYTVNPNGSVNPDVGWIRNYIRTEQVPILGAVTCNKAMLPQLR
jgi:hypothetical protein